MNSRTRGCISTGPSYTTGRIGATSRNVSQMPDIGLLVENGASVVGAVPTASLSVTRGDGCLLSRRWLALLRLPPTSVSLRGGAPPPPPPTLKVNYPLQLRG